MLPACGALEILCLSLNRVTAVGAAALAEALPACGVRLLDLSMNRIGDGGAAALATALPASRLDELRISYNVIGEDGSEPCRRCSLSGALLQTLWWSRLGAFGTERLTPTQQAANDAFQEAVRLRNANPDAWASLTVTE